VEFKWSEMWREGQRWGHSVQIHKILYGYKSVKIGNFMDHNIQENGK